MPTRRKSVAIFLVLAPLITGLAFFILFFTTSKAGNATASCKANNLTGLYDYDEKTATIGGESFTPPLFARVPGDNDTAVLGMATPSNKWIEIDLSEQKLKAWDGDNLFLESSIASGLPHTPTPLGEFRIWIKLRYAKMEGGTGRYYYNLPNVPYVMYFGNDKVPNYKGYGIHGVYWHNSFGAPRSHGCVNTPTPIAGQLYHWADPVLPPGKTVVYATEDNPGTRVVIHE